MLRQELVLTRPSNQIIFNSPATGYHRPKPATHPISENSPFPEQGALSISVSMAIFRAKKMISIVLHRGRVQHNGIMPLGSA